MSPLPLIAGISVDRATVEAAGWTLVHFLWQGALVAAALALADALLSRARPQLRYAAGCVALVTMCAFPLLTFVAARIAAAPPSPAFRAELAPRRAPAALDRAALAATPSSRAARAVARSGDLGWSDVRRLRDRFDASRLFPWCVGLWMAGVGLLSLRLLGGWWLVRRLATSPRNAPIDSCAAMWSRLVARMEITRPVRLVQSACVSVPTAIGWLRPVVLLPASTVTGLRPEQIEAILAHELAHIRRHDYAINLLQSLVETLLFYHPAVWWVSKRIRDERELCCDDLAVRAVGDPVRYARALCELEQLRGAGSPLALAATGGSLVGRVARLLGMAPRHARLEASRGLAWAAVATLVLVGGTAGGAVRVSPETQAVAAQATRRVVAAVVAPVAKVAGAEAEVAATLADLPLTADLVSVSAVEVALRAAATVATQTARAAATVAAEVACEVAGVESKDAREDAEAEADVVTVEAAEYDEGDAESRFTAQEWERLASAGVGPRYVANLARAGYPDLDVAELVKLAQHGVTSEYAGKLHRLLDGPSVDELVRLATHGITSTYVRAMRDELPEVEVEDLVRLASNGISSRYVAGIREMGVDDLETDDLIRLASNGVTLEWFSSLRWMGYEDVSVDRAIQLRNSGVTPEYASSLRILNRDQITLDELPELRNQGVEVEYAAAMLGLVRKDLSVSQLIQLRQQGVSVPWVASLNALGYDDLEAHELVTLRQQGVQPEFIAAMAGAGWDGLAANDLVRLVQQGITAEFAMRAREAGYEDLEVSDLIRLHQRGLPAKRVLP